MIDKWIETLKKGKHLKLEELKILIETVYYKIINY